MTTPFAKLVAASQKTERFTLVDLGCSGGLEAVWRLFGDRFRAVGFDASVAECRRLTAEEKQPDIHYVPGFVDIHPDHPFAGVATGKPFLPRNPFARFSAGWAVEIDAAHLKTASLKEKLNANAWGLSELADPKKPVFVPETLKGLGFDDVDLLKIDIDGPDYRVLRSFDGLMDGLGIVAARLEVNLFGGYADTLSTFSNTDRFMREQGFDLFGLDNRVYSNRALPAPFEYDMPAQTLTGRIYQAEAFYARDLGDDRSDVASKLSDEKIAKLAAIFSIWNQPDGAAELLVAFRGRLKSLFDVDAALDLLAAQAQAGQKTPLSYRDYVASFAANPKRFYPKPWSPATFLDRVAAAWRAWRDPHGAFPRKG